MDGSGRTWAIAQEGAGRPGIFLHGGPGLNDYGSLLTSETAGWQFIHYQQRGFLPPHGRALYAGTTLGRLAGGVGLRRPRTGHHNRPLMGCEPKFVRGDRGAPARHGACLGRSVGHRRGWRCAAHEPDVNGAAVARESSTCRPRGPAARWTRCNVECDGQRADNGIVVWPYNRRDLCTRFTPHRGPVEFVFGECSPIPHDGAVETVAVLSRSHLTVVPQAGHGTSSRDVWPMR